MKIIISGLGVMGASLAMALKESAAEASIFGFDRKDVLATALRKDIIDGHIKEWPQECKGADIIFLATPIEVIREQLLQLNGVIDDATVVSDLGSTKKILHDLVRSVSFSGTYIGGHPMTGAEKSGIAAANPLMYENAVYLLCPDEAQKQLPAFKKLSDLLSTIKARLFLTDATRHDEIMAYISHLPQVIALALVNIVGNKEDDEHPFFELAAGGFRDLTRIASSSPAVWQDIITSNKDNLQKAIKAFAAELEKYGSHLSNMNPVFEKAHGYRARMPQKSKGFLNPLCDVVVYVDDQVGVIAKISQALFAKNIDIRDIELLKIREKEGGVFRLSFADRSLAETAVKIMKEIGFDATVRE